jgi:SAM-dependent methyltransferase
VTDYLDLTRAAYDTVAADYAELLRDNLATMPWDRAMLGAFAELVTAAGGGRVADIGCGPGRVTEHLNLLGLNAFGIDLSPEMIAVARQWYPDLLFEVGAMPGLSIEDGSLGGIVAWYSIIHTPPELLPDIFDDFHRMLRPGGQVLLAFQAGNERKRLEHAYGHDVSYDAYRLPPDSIAEQLEKAGLTMVSRLVRAPEGPHEKTEQAYLLARKPEAEPQPTT